MKMNPRTAETIGLTGHYIALLVFMVNPLIYAFERDQFLYLYRYTAVATIFFVSNRMISDARYKMRREG